MGKNQYILNSTLATSIVGGLSLGLSFFFPLHPISPILGWIAAICLFKLYDKPPLNLFLAGVISHSIAFYWLLQTVQNFGGFPVIAALLIFILFLITHSLQFVIFGWLAKKLAKNGHFPAILTTSLAFIATSALFPRMFPWEIGHTQLEFISFAQLAEFGGVPLISFIMMILSGITVSVFTKKLLSPFDYFFITAFLVLNIWGVYRINSLEAIPGEFVDVVVVQRNISLDDKHDIKMFKRNTDDYIAASLDYKYLDKIIIWPESVITDPIPDSITHVNSNYITDHIFMNSAMLIGSLTLVDNLTYFNSALAVQQDGTIEKPYHKRILMPFGEYLPVGRHFPMIKKLFPMISDFTEGTSASVFDFKLCKDNSCKNVRISPLICYEDLLPSLAKESVNMGAQILVNLTNDAWFGNSPAPLQHHVIAAFRAIENRVPLIRSTNSGLTAIVSNTGRTTHKLPMFSSGIIEDSISIN